MTGAGGRALWLDRTGATAALALLALGAGAAVQARRADRRTALPCDAAEVRWVGEGPTAHATCGPGVPPPPAIAAVLGLRPSLNLLAESDLARLPGVGAPLAHALVRARPFRTWAEVDAVPGVGPARLAALRARTSLAEAAGPSPGSSAPGPAPEPAPLDP